MRYHKQKFKHDPENGVYGDCFRTAIACVMNLGRDEVPHFNDGAPTPDDFWPPVYSWLAERGLAIFSTPYGGSLESVLTTMRSVNGGLYYLLAGRSPRGTDHQVVCLDDRILHDPAIDGGNLVGPCSDGYFWVNVLVPAFHKVGGIDDATSAVVPDCTWCDKGDCGWPNALCDFEPRSATMPPDEQDLVRRAQALYLCAKASPEGLQKVAQQLGGLDVQVGEPTRNVELMQSIARCVLGSRGYHFQVLQSVSGRPEIIVTGIDREDGDAG